MGMALQFNRQRNRRAQQTDTLILSGKLAKKCDPFDPVDRRESKYTINQSSVFIRLKFYEMESSFFCFRFAPMQHSPKFTKH